MGISNARNRPFPARIRTLQFILLVLVSIISFGALVFPQVIRPGISEVQLGEVSPSDYQAPETGSFVSEVRTEERRITAENAVDKVYNSPDTRYRPSSNRATAGYTTVHHPRPRRPECDGFGSLEPVHDLNQPDITCLDGQTIHSQAGQSYTQWVPLHDPASAQTVCPIGHSDRPDSRYRTSTMGLWREAKLHPAPLSRAAVEKIAGERALLSGSHP